MLTSCFVQWAAAPTLSAESLQGLLNFAACLHWLGARRTVDADVLAAMVHTRLHGVGCSRSEVKLTDDEQLNLVDSCRNLFGPTKASHLNFLNSATRMRQTLIDRRAAHPVRWAVLLAVAGPTGQLDLARQYDEVLRRLPTLDLFRPGPAPRLTSAP